MPRTLLASSSWYITGSSNPSQPFSKPTKALPSRRPELTIEAMAVLRPAQSPPDVNMPILRLALLAIYCPSDLSIACYLATPPELFPSESSSSQPSNPPRGSELLGRADHARLHLEYDRRRSGGHPRADRTISC